MTAPDSGPAPGGQSTVTGIVYQLLWSVLESQRLLIAECDDAPHPRSATIILEPTDGGDLRTESGSGICVDQLKSCPPGKSWSLRELILEVLPDLYRAVRLDRPAQYRFVTEGQAGMWQEFGNLTELAANSDPADARFVEALPADDVAFRGKGAFWPAGTYSSRSLFELIAQTVREHCHLDDSETVGETHQKLRSLLAGFQLVHVQSAEITRRIDHRLTGWVTTEEVLGKRRELLGLMAELAKEGAELTPDILRAEARLESLPLHASEALLARARKHLLNHLSDRGYDAELDGRLDLAAEFALDAHVTPVLGIHGESGTGKSWLGFAIANALQDSGEFVVHLDSSGTVKRDLDRAARIFCEEYADRDESLSLSRLARHLGKLEPSRARLLTIVLDGVQSPAAAAAIAHHPWDSWRVGLVILASRDACTALERLLKGRARTFELGAFTAVQRDDYLTARLGSAWHGVPEDVLALLKKPLLAHLYCEVAKGDAWRPESEYELFARFWHERLTDGDIGVMSEVRTGLIRHARTVIAEPGEAHLPELGWTEEDCITTFGNGHALEAALRSGWWVRKGESRYGFAHDRLMNWCVARAVSEVATPEDVERLREALHKTETSARQSAGGHLGYVAMDALWMITRDGRTTAEETASVLETIESCTPRAGATLYDGVVRTIGEQVSPALVVRLKQAAENDYLPLVNSIIRALAHVGGVPGVHETALSWIEADQGGVRAAGVRLLQEFPSLTAADTLWSVLSELHDSERTSRSMHEMTAVRKALRACTSSGPDWIRTKARTTKPNEPVHALASLLLGHPDGAALWNELKAVFRGKIQGVNRYVLALNARCHGDDGDVAWLRSLVREKGIVGGVSFEALVTIDANTAIQEIKNLSESNIYEHRQPGFQRLLELRRAETIDALHERLDCSTNRLVLIRAFEGSPNAMDPRTLGMALDLLLQELQLGATAEPKKSYRISSYLELLAGVTRLELVEILESKAGTALEREIVNWLRQHRRQGMSREPGAQAALILLDRFGGKGLTQVVIDWLASTSRQAVDDALDHAHKRPDDTVLGLLTRLCAGSTPLGSDIGSNYRAFLCLARTGAWDEVFLGLLDPAICNPQLLDELWLERPIHPYKLHGELLQSVTEAAEDRDGPVGALGALGLAENTEMANVLRDALAYAAPGSARSLFALFGYCRLTPAEEIQIDLIRPILASQDGRKWAIQELGRVGEGVALDELASELGRGDNPRLALYLARKGRTRAIALQALRDQAERISTSYVPAGVELLGDIEDPALRERVRDAAFEATTPLPGADPAGYIRALARFDPVGAFLAARRRLEATPESKRWKHVHLLVEIDPVRGAEALLDLAEHSTSSLFLAAIANALKRAPHDADVSSQLRQRLLGWHGSQDLGLLTHSCRLAGSLGHPEQVIQGLPDLLRHPDASAAEAAFEALQEIRNEESLSELLGALAVETDPDRRRRLTDCALHIGNVGLSGEAPEWVQEEFRISSGQRLHELEERVKERRKKQIDELHKQDRREV